MDEFDAKVRGERARQITQDPVYIDAVEAAKRSIHVALSTMKVTDERAAQVALIHVIRLQLLEETVFQLQSIMTTGESA
ncbi:MAG: hypothetical protein ACJ8HI_23225 [Massilia sp.]|jgi:hypothetical protein